MLRAWGNRVDGIFGQRRSVARSGSVRSALNHIGSGPRTKDYFLGAPDDRMPKRDSGATLLPCGECFVSTAQLTLDAQGLDEQPRGGLG